MSSAAQETDVLSNDINRMIFNDQSGLLNNVLNYYPILIERLDLNHRTWMHHAADAGSWGCMEVLRKHGLEVDSPDVSGETPLHRAVARNHMEAAEWLLSQGADPNARNRLGGTPTLYAAEWSADALERLLMSGGDASVVDYSHQGIEQWAARDSFLNRLTAHRQVQQEASQSPSALKL